MKKLSCADGHVLDAVWKTPSSGQAERSLVLLHEIFGLTDYIDELCEYWAEQGFNILAPALFDRLEPGLVIDYSKPQNGLRVVSELKLDGLIEDISTCVRYLRMSGFSIGVVGYCWGGGLAYRAACDLKIDAAACIYPTRLLQHIDQSPNCPVQFQFAERDKHASEEVKRAMADAAPDAEQIVFPADHAFDRKVATVPEEEVRNAGRNALKEFFSRHLNS